MKGLKSAIATYVVVAGCAVYVGLAPLSDPASKSLINIVLAVLDLPAMALIGISGRSNTVLGLLAAAVVLTLVLLMLASMRTKAADKPAKAPRKVRVSASSTDTETGEDAAAGILSVKRQQSRPANDRLRALRNRAGGEAANDHPEITPFDITEAEAGAPAALVEQESAAPEAVSPEPLSPRPVFLVRKARERERNWQDDPTWLGGLPRLGDSAWPRDPAGKPLPFACQIDLGQLTSACPESPLPTSGSLAFFLGSGAVLHVEGDGHDVTPAPADLPSAFDEGGSPFPSAQTRISRPTFRFWPVDVIAIDMPADMRGISDETQHAAITDAMYERLDARVPERHAGRDDQESAVEGSDELWWYGVRHLADRLKIAEQLAADRVADARRAVEAANETVFLHKMEGSGELALTEAARSSLDQAQARLDDIAAQAESLPQMVAAVDQFAAHREDWERLSAQEAEVVADILIECRETYPDLVRGWLPSSVRDLHVVCVREMMTGDAAALAAMPQPLLDFRNAHHRLTGASQHQVFGLGACQQHALYDHLADLLLLQLASDADMDWQFGDGALYQFWISPDDAAQGRWENAVLTFEAG